ncbi:MAG: IMP cyclohydrolase [Candidatus Woesearchaeota archaeon]|nr:IMP cyclohydrolase [Candidatus Woesearchaeota archaeon]
MNALEVLANMEYPGRFMILGLDERGNKNIVVYGITGRSPPSRARVLIQADDKSIHTKPTDPAQLAKGNPALLVYSAIKPLENTLIVSNGAQTDLIHDTAKRLRQSDGTTPTPLQILTQAFQQSHYLDPAKPGEPQIDVTSFEPDHPNYTPRISGVLRHDLGALALAKRDIDCAVKRHFFEFALHSGRGFLLATYTGENVVSGCPLPSFRGEPIQVGLPRGTATDITHQIYEALGPKQGERILDPGNDMRVGVVTMTYNFLNGTTDISMKNRMQQQ